ncbi:MAG: M20 family metallopeptidase [bacterium]|nr:M20 family metallopeptidase [bacterium]
MDKRELVNQYFSEHKDQIQEKIINLTTEMVAEKTVNVQTSQLSEHPYLKTRGEEYKVAKIVKNEFDKVGIAYDEYSRISERPNVIGRMGKNNSGISLFMAGHMDVVPAGDGWDSDPYKVIQKDGKLYGRGTSDNKGQIASILAAAAILKELELDKDLNGELQIAALSDEECCDPDGIDYGVHYLLEEKLINPTYAIIPDIGEYMRSIDVAEKGGIKLQVTATGRQAHGSTPEKGINAINMMAEFIHNFQDFELKHTEHPLLGHPTVNVGVINGGAASNIVPGSCYVHIDMRTVPGVTLEQIEKEVKKYCDLVKNGNFKIEFLSVSEPHSIDPDNDLVKLIQKHGEPILGFKPVPIGLGGGTFAKGLCLHGCKAVGWGIGNEDTMHVANEYIEIDQLMDFAQLTCLLALDLLS